MKRRKPRRCTRCNRAIKRGKEAWFHSDLVCQGCFDNLKKPLPNRVRISWLTKLAREMEETGL